MPTYLRSLVLPGERNIGAVPAGGRELGGVPPDDEDPSAALILASRVDTRESSEADTAVWTDWPTSCWSATTGEMGEVDGADDVGGVRVGAVVEVPELGAEEAGTESDVDAIQNAIGTRA